MPELVKRGPGAWEIPGLPGHVVRTSKGYLYDGPGDASIAIDVNNPGSAGIMFGELLRREVPHARLERRQSGYYYRPWNFRITVDQYNPGWGNTFKAEWMGCTFYLNRLRNFRAFLRLLMEEGLNA